MADSDVMDAVVTLYLAFPKVVMVTTAMLMLLSLQACLIAQ